MSTTIYRAIPNNPDVSITHLNESLQFIGNDVESITIDNIQYGCTFTLDEFEGLREINIKKPGIVLSFSKFPEQTIHVRGAFEEIRIKHNDEFCNLHSMVQTLLYQ